MTRAQAEADMVDMIDMIETPFIDRYGEEFALSAEMTGIVATAVAMGLSREELLTRLGERFDVLADAAGPAVVDAGRALRRRKHGEPS